MPTERDIQGKGTKAPGGKRAPKSKKNPGSSAGSPEVFLIFREKRSKIKLLWKRRRSSSYLNGMSGVQFTRNQDNNIKRLIL